MDMHTLIPQCCGEALKHLGRCFNASLRRGLPVRLDLLVCKQCRVNKAAVISTRLG